MKITYKNIITTLKFITTASFIVALGFKLYNIYKYGGPKKPEKPVEKDDDDEYDEVKEDGYPVNEVYGSKDITSETEAYDSEDYPTPNSYREN